MLKASLLYPMVNAKTSTERNYDGRRKTKNGAKTNAAGWLGNGLFRRSLFPEGRTYSPPPKCTAFWRRWYPDRVDIPPNRAVRSPRGMRGALRSLRGAPDDAGKAPLVRAAGSAVMDSASRNCPGCCGALHRPTSAFTKSVTDRFCKWAGHWFTSGQLLREKERIATAPSEPRNDKYERETKTTKGSENVWRFTTWKQR